MVRRTSHLAIKFQLVFEEEAYVECGCDGLVNVGASKASWALICEGAMQAPSQGGFQGLH